MAANMKGWVTISGRLATRGMRIAATWYPLLLVLASWELVARSGWVEPLFLPSIVDVSARFQALIFEGQVGQPLLLSLFRASAGLAVAIGAGVLIGLALAQVRWVRWAFDPIVSLAFPAPKIAFMPIFVLWFGIDHLSKILLVAFTCVFPIIIATYHGATSVSRTIIWSALAMGTTRNALMLKIVLPATMPFIHTGVRITVPMALITAFTAEMVAGGGGVGAVLMYAQRFFESPSVFAYIVVMAGTGLVVDRLVLALRRMLVPWHLESAAN